MYTLNWYNPALPSKAVPLNIPVGAVVSNLSSIRLTGKGAAAYGSIQQMNLLWMLENFASDNAPTNPTVGQEWYDTTNSILKVCTSTSPLVWKSLGGIQVTNVGDPAPTPTSLGDVWFQRTGTSSGVLYVFTGTGRYPNTATTIGGWNQVWPSTTIVAGREEYDAMLAIVNQLVGDPTTYGGSGAAAKVLTLTDLKPLDTALYNAWVARPPVDPNILTPIADSPAELLVDPDSNDWDLLLAAAKWAVDRLDLPFGFSSDISPVPFITDGRQAPTALTALTTSDIRYPSLERRSNRKFGIVTLLKAYQETANVLLAAQQNRYAIKGINGATGANATFPSVVTTTTWGNFSGAAGGATAGTMNFLIPFGSVAAVTSFLASGGALQFRFGLTNGTTTGDTSMKAMFDQRGVIRLTADKGRTFANVAPYAQSAAIQTGGAAVSQAMPSGAALSVSMTSMPNPGSLNVTLSFTAPSAMQGTVTIGVDIIRDTSVTSAGTGLYPAPNAAPVAADFISKSPWITAP